MKIFSHILFLALSLHMVIGFTDELDVLTYNVQMRPVLDQNIYKGRRISPKLNAYDIALLQESFAEKAVLMEQARHAYKAHFTARRGAALVDSGLSTLSRYPVVETITEHYRSYAGIADGVASKGMMLTRIRVGEAIVDVYNTHMQAGDSDDENRARLAQATQLIEFVNRNSTKANGILIIGDFNMGPVRPGRMFRDFHPNHYANRRDMLLRTNSFQTIVDNLGLTDVQDMLMNEKVDDIERMLFRNGCGVTITPMATRKDTRDFVDEKGRKLSDSSPLVTTFKIEVTDELCEATPLIPNMPTSTEVRLYQDCKMNGPMLSIPMNESRKLNTGLIFDNSISSIQLGKDTRALLAQNPDGTGRSVCLKKLVRCFADYKDAEWLNDSVSYVRVYDRNDPNLPDMCR